MMRNQQYECNEKKQSIIENYETTSFTMILTGNKRKYNKETTNENEKEKNAKKQEKEK